MKAADVKGKRIQRLIQSRKEWNSGYCWTIDAIEFTDGTVMRFGVVEGEGEYGVDVIYPARAIDVLDGVRHTPDPLERFCPTCDAIPGHPCRGHHGAIDPHSARIRASKR